MRYYDGEVQLEGVQRAPEVGPGPEEEQACLAPIEYVCEGHDPCEKMAEEACSHDACFDELFETVCDDERLCLDWIAEQCPGAEFCELLPEFGCEDPAGGVLETVGFDGYSPYLFDGWLEVVWPAEPRRVGILGTLAFLSLQSTEIQTSPTRRGRFVMESLLCRSVPSPPNLAVTAAPPRLEGQSRRERLEAHLSDPACASCHVGMDGLGFPLEEFGPGGLYRTRDDEGYPLDLTGELDGESFSGLSGLAPLLAANADAQSCMARQIYRFALGVADDVESPELREDLNRFFETGGGSYRGFALELGGSSYFLEPSSFDVDTTLAPTLANVTRHLFEPHCARCHGEVPLGGLDLRERAELHDDLIRQETLDGTARLVVPNDPDRSLVWAKVVGRHAELGASGDRMPPGQELDPSLEDLLRRWIQEGARP
jgi:hypothetical protein